jgi:hypothetical protein
VTVFAAAGFLLEEYYYHSSHCKLSDRYLQQLHDLTVKVVQALEENDIPYFADFATLLSVIRVGKIPWDPDNDFSIVWKREISFVFLVVLLCLLCSPSSLTASEGHQNLLDLANTLGYAVFNKERSVLLLFLFRLFLFG